MQCCVAKPLPAKALEAFGVFDSFNYPRPSNKCYHVSDDGDIMSNGTCPEVGFEQPDPNSDWANAY